MPNFETRVDACVFDLDGTLVDTLGDFVAVLHLALSDLGLPGPGRAVVERLVGRGSEHLIRSVLEQVGASPGLYEPAWARYQHHYAALNGRHAEVCPGVLPALDALQARGVPLAVLTNKPGAFARELLRRKGMLERFAHVFGGDDFERKKPDPLPLLKACEALGTEPSATWMVGDSRNDAQAAAGAGCPLVLVTYGYNHGEDIRAVPAREHVGRLDQISWMRIGATPS